MSNLKPFNLPEALAGKAVMLRDGQKAYVRHHETELNARADYRLLGYAADGDQLSWCESGSYISATVSSGGDIIGMYPESRIINGFEVPAPETETLEEGCTYFLTLPHSEDLYVRNEWGYYNAERLWISRGLIFLCKEDAIATAKAMLGINPYEGDE